MAKKPNTNLVRIGAAVIVVGVAGGFWLYERQAGRKAAAQDAAGWMIAGAACPTPAPGAAPPPLPRRMDYEETAIEREVAGAVNCNTIKENGDGATLKICQFITPGAIRITTRKGAYSFAPRRGEDASLVIRDDVPSCVLHVNPALFN